ncbi:NAD(P)H-binding protein [Paenibacillus septentrionalis]|uniref:NAD(P)H-binding protein n=1 Tax=Paenibacillus septentrionalis TaxID=429342 RepID=A0ABW1VC26_9BACL
MKAVIVGATGLVGRELVRLLLNNKNYSKVTVIARKRLSVVHPRLEQQLISFDELHECPKEWFEDADVFCALGTTIKKAKTKEMFRRVDHDYVIEVGKLVVRHQARKLIVVTAMGANEQSMFFYNKVKGQTERDLQELKLPQLIIVRPSLIIGDRHEFRFGEAMAVKLSGWLSFAFKGRMSKYKPNEAKVIAQALSKLALLCTEQVRVVTSDEISYWSRQKVY